MQAVYIWHELDRQQLPKVDEVTHVSVVEQLASQMDVGLATKKPWK